MVFYHTYNISKDKMQMAEKHFFLNVQYPYSPGKCKLKPLGDFTLPPLAKLSGFKKEKKKERN